MNYRSDAHPGEKVAICQSPGAVQAGSVPYTRIPLRVAEHVHDQLQGAATAASGQKQNCQFFSAVIRSANDPVNIPVDWDNGLLHKLPNLVAGYITILVALTPSRPSGSVPIINQSNFFKVFRIAFVLPQ